MNTSVWAGSRKPRGDLAGTRVALYCSLACEVRGIRPLCRPARRGTRLCARTDEPAAVADDSHGEQPDVNGGFAEKVAAHRAQSSDPRRVTDERPCSRIRSAWRCIPSCVIRRPGSARARVRMAASGSASSRRCDTYIAMRVWAVARYPIRQDGARFGAKAVFPSAPAELIEQIAAKQNATFGSRGTACLARTRRRDDLRHHCVEGDGGNLASHCGQTFTVVHIGVSTPKRFEWTLLYFKELEVKVQRLRWLTWQGRRMHAYELYWNLIGQGWICRGS